MHSVQSMGRRDACLSTYLPTYLQRSKPTRSLLLMGNL
jgi:hypothetical protein